MGFCVSCAKDVASEKFCPDCGRQLLSSQELGSQSTPQIEESAVRKGNANMALWAHLAPILGAILSIWYIVAAFVLWLPGLLVRNSATASDFEKRHGTEAMNFQLTVLLFTAIGVFVSIVTLGVGLLVTIPAGFALLIASLVFMIMGAVAASQGREYRYPLSIRFVK